MAHFSPSPAPSSPPLRSSSPLFYPDTLRNTITSAAFLVAYNHWCAGDKSYEKRLEVINSCTPHQIILRKQNVRPQIIAVIKRHSEYFGLTVAENDQYIRVLKTMPDASYPAIDIACDPNLRNLDDIGATIERAIASNMVPRTFSRAINL